MMEQLLVETKQIFHKTKIKIQNNTAYGLINMFVEQDLEVVAHNS